MNILVKVHQWIKTRYSLSWRFSHNLPISLRFSSLNTFVKTLNRKLNETTPSTSDGSIATEEQQEQQGQEQKKEHEEPDILWNVIFFKFQDCDILE